MIIDRLNKFSTKSPSSHFNCTVSVVKGRGKVFFGNDEIYGRYTYIEIQFTIIRQGGLFFT